MSACRENSGEPKVRGGAGPRHGWARGVIAAGRGGSRRGTASCRAHEKHLGTPQTAQAKPIVILRNTRVFFKARH